MTDGSHYEQLLRRCNILAEENAQLRQLMADAEDELAERRGRARLEGRLRAAWQSTILEARKQAARADAAEAALAALHEGEEPYEDERVAPTPAQWIWHWNRATPAERLSMAAYRLDLLERFHRCVNGMHESRISEYNEHRQVERERAERYLSAWRSARRRAAQAEAKLAEPENEDEGDWMSGMLWARKLGVVYAPLVSPAFTGDTTDPWETAAEAARQHELVKQRLADYLSADPESHQPVCAHPVSRLGMDPVTSATVCRCGQWITPPAFPRQDQS